MKPVSKLDLNKIGPFFDEDSDAFKRILTEHGLEQKIRSFKFNPSTIISGMAPAITPFSYPAKACYNYIDELIYVDLERLLKRQGLGYCLDDISSIIKWGYYQHIWLKANKNQIETSKGCRKELS